MNKIAKIAVVVSIALAFTACGEDKKKAEAEAKRVQDSITAAQIAADAAAATEKMIREQQAKQDSITAAQAAEAAEKRAKDSMDSVATAAKGKKAAPKAVAPPPAAAPAVAPTAAQQAGGKSR